MKELIDLYKYEKEYNALGYKLIAGVDEAGRGPLVGPVYCAAVILDPNNPIDGLNDSKKLTPKKREALYKEIKEKALAYKVTPIDAETIDRINILEASRLGMEKSIKNLSVKPDFILTDYMDLHHTDIKYFKLAHGDALSATIGAASILAKVERDHYLDELDKLYPMYNFKNNKGYLTKGHKEALLKYGPCPLHRKTFEPVKSMQNIQLSLDI